MRHVRTIFIGALLLACFHVARAGFLGIGGKKKKACDLSVGSWAPSTKYPVYDSSCPYISQDFNCEKNGRPDGDFRHFEWKPSGCKLTRFDAKKFAMTFVGQAVAIVGDNSGQYMYQSLRCRLDAAGLRLDSSLTFLSPPLLPLLSPSSPPPLPLLSPSSTPPFPLPLSPPPPYPFSNRPPLLQESSNSTYYSKGRAIASQPSGIAALNIVLHPPPSPSFPSPFPHPGILQPHSNVMLVQPYALSIPPAHMPNMFQYADTTCALFAGPLSTTATDLAKARSSVVAWTNAQINALSKSRVKLLNILSLSLYRADAHVGTYRPAGGSTEMDCAKWCLPGVPDVWLDLWYHQVSDPFNLKP
ncbi:unnamed protein product [Closterium sp. NIES-53]